MGYNSEDVAEYIIKYCNNANISIPNYKLQQLLYLVNCSLMRMTKSYIKDEFELLHGKPFYKKIYNKYCCFGAMSIYLYTIMEKSFNFKKEDKIAIDEVLGKYNLEN